MGKTLLVRHHLRRRRGRSLLCGKFCSCCSVDANVQKSKGNSLSEKFAKKKSGSLRVLKTPRKASKVRKKCKKRSGRVEGCVGRNRIDFQLKEATVIIRRLNDDVLNVLEEFGTICACEVDPRHTECSNAVTPSVRRPCLTTPTRRLRSTPIQPNSRPRATNVLHKLPVLNADWRTTTLGDNCCLITSKTAESTPLPEFLMKTLFLENLSICQRTPKDESAKENVKMALNENGRISGDESPHLKDTTGLVKPQIISKAAVTKSSLKSILPPKSPSIKEPIATTQKSPLRCEENVSRSPAKSQHLARSPDNLRNKTNLPGFIPYKSLLQDSVVRSLENSKVLGKNANGVRRQQPLNCKSSMNNTPDNRNSSESSKRPGNLHLDYTSNPTGVGVDASACKKQKIQASVDSSIIVAKPNGDAPVKSPPAGKSIPSAESPAGKTPPSARSLPSGKTLSSVKSPPTDLKLSSVKSPQGGKTMTPVKSPSAGKAPPYGRSPPAGKTLSSVKSLSADPKLSSVKSPSAGKTIPPVKSSPAGEKRPSAKSPPAAETLPFAKSPPENKQVYTIVLSDSSDDEVCYVIRPERYEARKDAPVKPAVVGGAGRKARILKRNSVATPRLGGSYQETYSAKTCPSSQSPPASKTPAAVKIPAAAKTCPIVKIPPAAKTRSPVKIPSAAKTRPAIKVPAANKTRGKTGSKTTNSSNSQAAVKRTNRKRKNLPKKKPKASKPVSDSESDTSEPTNAFENPNKRIGVQKKSKARKSVSDSESDTREPPLPAKRIRIRRTGCRSCPGCQIDTPRQQPSKVTPVRNNSKSKSQSCISDRPNKVVKIFPKKSQRPSLKSESPPTIIIHGLTSSDDSLDGITDGKVFDDGRTALVIEAEPSSRPSPSNGPDSSVKSLTKNDPESPRDNVDAANPITLSSQEFEEANLDQISRTESSPCETSSLVQKSNDCVELARQNIDTSICIPKPSGKTTETVDQHSSKMIETSIQEKMAKEMSVLLAEKLPQNEVLNTSVADHDNIESHTTSKSERINVKEQGLKPSCSAHELGIDGSGRHKLNDVLSESKDNDDINEHTQASLLNPVKPECNNAVVDNSEETLKIDDTIDVQSPGTHSNSHSSSELGKGCDSELGTVDMNIPDSHDSIDISRSVGNVTENMSPRCEPVCQGSSLPVEVVGKASQVSHQATLEEAHSVCEVPDLFCQVSPLQATAAVHENISEISQGDGMQPGSNSVPTTCANASETKETSEIDNSLATECEGSHTPEPLESVPQDGIRIPYDLPDLLNDCLNGLVESVKLDNREVTISKVNLESSESGDKLANLSEPNSPDDSTCLARDLNIAVPLNPRLLIKKVPLSHVENAAVSAAQSEDSKPLCMAERNNFLSEEAFGDHQVPESTSSDSPDMATPTKSLYERKGYPSPIKKLNPRVLSVIKYNDLEIDNDEPSLNDPPETDLVECVSSTGIRFSVNPECLSTIEDILNTKAVVDGMAEASASTKEASPVDELIIDNDEPPLNPSPLKPRKLPLPMTENEEDLEDLIIDNDAPPLNESADLKLLSGDPDCLVISSDDEGPIPVITPQPAEISELKKPSQPGMLHSRSRKKLLRKRRTSLGLAVHNKGISDSRQQLEGSLERRSSVVNLVDGQEILGNDLNEVVIDDCGIQTKRQPSGKPLPSFGTSISHFVENLPGQLNSHFTPNQDFGPNQQGLGPENKIDTDQVLLDLCDLEFSDSDIDEIVIDDSGMDSEHQPSWKPLPPSLGCRETLLQPQVFNMHGQPLKLDKCFTNPGLDIQKDLPTSQVPSNLSSPECLNVSDTLTASEGDDDVTIVSSLPEQQISTVKKNLNDNSCDSKDLSHIVSDSDDDIILVSGPDSFNPVNSQNFKPTVVNPPVEHASSQASGSHVPKNIVHPPSSPQFKPVPPANSELYYVLVVPPNQLFPT